MSNYIYEYHIHVDPSFPIIFHKDVLDEYRPSIYMHYHENLEILYFLDGKANINCDHKVFEAKKGDIIILNSNELHSIDSIDSSCIYYCLILNTKLIFPNELLKEIRFNSKINDSFIESKFKFIESEMKMNKDFFKEFIKSDIIQILIHLYRNYISEENIKLNPKTNNKISLVKEILSYLKDNYKEQISIKDVCNHVSFSKYYVCHVFKEITGKTLLDYINFLRCLNARKLMLYNGESLSESAYKSGFNNLSYFSKTYKKHLGILPSKEKIP